MPYRSLRPSFYADLVGHIYEAAFTPARWHDAVDALVDLYPDSRVALFAHRYGRPVEGMAVNTNFPVEALRAYVDYYAANSPHVARAKQLAVGCPVYGEQSVPIAELRKTEHFNDFTRPHRLGYYATGVVAERDEGGMIALSIADHQDDPQRRAHQLDLLGVIAPHLVRAARLRRAMLAHETKTAAVAAVFDRWAHAAFVVDAGRKVATMNEAAAVLLEQADGLGLDRHGRLSSFDDKACRALDALICQCLKLTDRCDVRCGDTERDGVALPRRSEATSLQAVAWPLPHLDARAEFEGRRGRVLIIIFDPDRPPPTQVGWLARRFGLSSAERALVQALVDGLTLADAAERLGIALSTARTRLKTIQSKTGCRRQAELLRLALLMPAVRRS